MSPQFGWFLQYPVDVEVHSKDRPPRGVVIGKYQQSKGRFENKRLNCWETSGIVCVGEMITRHLILQTGFIEIKIGKKQNGGQDSPRPYISTSIFPYKFYYKFRSSETIWCSAIPSQPTQVNDDPPLIMESHRNS